MSSTLGMGHALANPFNRIASECAGSFPNGRRGSTLLIAGDFSGSHKGQLYETYSFLALDIDQNSEWQLAQRHFRRAVLLSRRMSFKALNDAKRRAAIVPFLQAANCINGWFVTFAISREGSSLFAKDHSPHTEGWKGSVREKLARVTHLSSYLLAGLARPGQDVYWIIDEDDIAANADQLTRLTDHIANVSSHFAASSLRHLRCATTKSDIGDFMLEDMCAVCDLAAGATAETLTLLTREKRRISKEVVSPLPPGVSWKSGLIVSWLASQSQLRWITFQIDLVACVI